MLNIEKKNPNPWVWLKDLWVFLGIFLNSEEHNRGGLRCHNWWNSRLSRWRAGPPLATPDPFPSSLLCPSSFPFSPPSSPISPPLLPPRPQAASWMEYAAWESPGSLPSLPRASFPGWGRCGWGIKLLDWGQKEAFLWKQVNIYVIRNMIATTVLWFDFLKNVCRFFIVKKMFRAE